MTMKLFCKTHKYLMKIMEAIQHYQKVNIVTLLMK